MDTKRLKGGFKIALARDYDAIEAREMIPEPIKYKLVTKFLKARRKQRAKDYEDFLLVVETWKKNSRWGGAS